MNKELRNRERRLRYKARKKGLHISKRTHRIGDHEYIGYRIMKPLGTVIDECECYWDELPPIDDAEKILDEYADEY